MFQTINILILLFLCYACFEKPSELVFEPEKAESGKEEGSSGQAPTPGPVPSPSPAPVPSPSPAPAPTPASGGTGNKKLAPEFFALTQKQILYNFSHLTKVELGHPEIQLTTETLNLQKETSYRSYSAFSALSLIKVAMAFCNIYVERNYEKVNKTTLTSMSYSASGSVFKIDNTQSQHETKTADALLKNLTHTSFSQSPQLAEIRAEMIKILSGSEFVGANDLSKYIGDLDNTCSSAECDETSGTVITRQNILLGRTKLACTYLLASEFFSFIK